MSESSPSTEDSVIEVARSYTAGGSRLENLVVPIWKKKKYAKHQNKNFHNQAGLMSSPLPPSPNYTNVQKIFTKSVEISHSGSAYVF